MEPTASEPPTRPVGRPGAGHKGHKKLSDDVREEILTAAAQLFEANGLTATTTAAIAAAAGLSEASVFHYFDRKQDIMVELLGRAVRPTLKVVRQNRLELYEPDVAVWQLVHMDVSILCRGPATLAHSNCCPKYGPPNSTGTGGAGTSSSGSTPTTSPAASSPAFSPKATHGQPASSSSAWSRA